MNKVLTDKTEYWEDGLDECFDRINPFYQDNLLYEDIKTFICHLISSERQKAKQEVIDKLKQFIERCKNRNLELYGGKCLTREDLVQLMEYIYSSDSLKTDKEV